MTWTSSLHGRVSDDAYLKAQAKKNLAEWKARGRHSDMTVKLFHAISRLEATKSELGLEGRLEQLVREQFTMANNVFQEAKKAVTVIAHVNALEGLSGEERRDTVTALHQKDHDVPRALKQELERVYKTFSKLPARSAPAGRKRKAAE